jgi:hypothetical protein
MQASYVEIRIILQNLHYPVNKQNLIQQAIKHGASRIVIEDLKSIQDREYTSSANVLRNLEANNLNGVNQPLQV